MYIDRIDLVVPQADIASILSAYSGAEALLEPLPSVSKSDRKRYAKLGLKNEALALQIIEVARANPNLIPRGIDFEMIDRDITARAQLKLLKIQLQRMLSRVDDAMLLLGVDVYAAALSMYHCLRRNADTTSLKESVDELRKGFARPSRKKKEEPESAPVHAKTAAAEPTTTSPRPRCEAAPEQGVSMLPMPASGTWAFIEPAGAQIVRAPATMVSPQSKTLQSQRPVPTVSWICSPQQFGQIFSGSVHATTDVARATETPRLVSIVPA